MKHFFASLSAFLFVFLVMPFLALADGGDPMCAPDLFCDATAPTVSVEIVQDEYTSLSDDGYFIPSSEETTLRFSATDDADIDPVFGFLSWEMREYKGEPQWETNTCGNLSDPDTKFRDTNPDQDTLIGVTNQEYWYERENWTSCYQYDIIAEDYAGNISVSEKTKPIMGDPTTPLMVVNYNGENSWEQSGGNEFKLPGEITEFKYEDIWRNDENLTIDWTAKDDQSGIGGQRCSYTKNEGVPINIANCTDTGGSVTFNEDGVYVITLEYRNAGGDFDAKRGVTKAEITVKRDTTAPELTIILDDTLLAGSHNVKFEFDDRNELLDTQVSQVEKEDVLAKLFLCEEARPCDVQEGGDISFKNEGSDNTESKTLDFLKAKHNTDNTSGEYRIEFTITDVAGNTAVEEKIVTVYPNNEVKMTSAWKSDCNNLIADATETCTATLTLTDFYNNPVYSKNIINLAPKSQTVLNMFDGNDEAAEIVEQENFAGNNALTEITTDTNGQATIFIRAYAPSDGLKTINFGGTIKEHDTLYVDTFVEMDLLTTDDLLYTFTEYFKSPTAYEDGSRDVIIMGEENTFILKAPQTLNYSNVSNSSKNARIGVYVHTDDEDFYTHDHKTKGDNTFVMKNAITDENSKYIPHTIIDILDHDTDPMNVTDTVIWLGGDHETYSYSLEFTRINLGLPAPEKINITPVPFVYYKLRDKDVAYFNKDSGIIKSYELLILSAKSRTSAGFVQSNIGEVLNDDDVNTASLGGVTVQDVSSWIKARVKQQSLSLDEDSICAGACTLKQLGAFNSDEGFDTDVGIYKLNNRRTYMTKGADLVIDGDILIGKEPLSIISYGGNVIIKGNIKYAENVGGVPIPEIERPTIAIIALMDESSGTGGEIHIANNSNTTAGGVFTALTEVVGSLIAERGVVGMNKDGNIDAIDRNKELTNQLRILGNIMGRNTLGGGTKGEKGVCPNFIKASDCTLDTAQKYDLNYLRRFYWDDDGFGVNQNYQGDKDNYEWYASNSEAETDPTDKTRPLVLEYYINNRKLPKELQQ
jgi:hypothetical protein